MSDSVIPAVSRQIRTMVDGTLRLQIDFEPGEDARSAFILFCDPGTPLGVVRLKVGTQTEPTPEPEPATEPAKGGPLAKWAALRCQDERFRAWLRVADELTARGEILAKCRIRSRAELDSNPEAAGLFARHFRRPWADHCKCNGWAD